MFNNYDKNSQNKVLIFTDLAKHIFLDNQETNILDNKYNVDFLFCYPETSVNNNYFNNVDIFLYEKFLNIKFVPVINEKNFPFTTQLYLENKLVDFVNIDSIKEKYEFNYAIGDDIKSFFGYLNLGQDSLSADNNFYFYKKISDNTKIGCFINEPEYYKGISSIKYYIDKLSISGTEINTFNYKL
jgi:hypothetical protein